MTSQSQASAGFDNHVAVLLEDDVVVVVVEKHRDGAELGGGAARLRDLLWLQEMNLTGDTQGQEINKRIMITIKISLCNHRCNTKLALTIILFAKVLIIQYFPCVNT